MFEAVSQLLRAAPAPSSPPARSRAARLLNGIAIAVAFGLGAIALITTSLNGWQAPKIGERQGDYYNSLTRSLLHGKPWLDISVSDEVLHLPNPWDPLQANGRMPMDASYYKGHYYSYFGVVPALTVFLPFKVLTRHELPLVYGSLVFAVGALVIAGLLWVRVIADAFPNHEAYLAPLGILAIGLCGGQWGLARRVSIWEPSITSGHFFMAAFVAAGYLALRNHHPFRWLALCALSLALAVGCRPDLGVALPALGLAAVLVLVRAAKHSDLGWSRALGRLAVAALPSVCVGAGLLVYNKVRFDSFLEFGLHYQPGNHEAALHPLFSPTYFLYDLHFYGFASPGWGRYFPFIHPPAFYPSPPGHVAYEFTYGAWVTNPFLWGVAGLAFGAGRLPVVSRWFVAFLATMACMLTATLLCFNTVAGRYQVDFLPWWIWLAAIGWACALAACADGKWLSAALRGFLVLATAASLLVGFLESVIMHDIFRNSNPEGYVAVERALDTPIGLWDRLTGFKPGPVSFDLTLNGSHRSAVEPLMVAGAGYEKSYLFLFYQSDHSAKICFEANSHPPVSSDTLTFEPGRTYRVSVVTPALYPPEGHPYFRDWSEGQVHSAKSWVRVEVDGKRVLLSAIDAVEATPGSLRFASDVKGGYGGEALSGTITHVRRDPVRESTSPTHGIIDLAVHLPPRASPVSAPLVQVGKEGNAISIGLLADGGNRYRYSVETWGVGMIVTPQREAPGQDAIRMRLQIGPAMRDVIKPIHRSVIIWEEGRPVCWVHLPVDLPDGPTHYFINAVRSSAALPAFNGNIESVESSPTLPPWRPGPFRKLTLLMLGRGGGMDPVLTVGSGAEAVFLGVHWLPDDRAQWIYRTRTSQIAGPLLAWPDGHARAISIELPAFAALDSTRAAAGAPLRISEGSKVLWEDSVEARGAPSASVCIGANGAKFTGCADELGCAVGSVAQE